MSELSSAELKVKIAAILKEADLETTSAKKVRMQLEEDLKTDLTGRKEEIGKIIQVCSTSSHPVLEVFYSRNNLLSG